MSEYIPSNVLLKYKPSANPPVLDRVVFTIDHIHGGNNHVPSTFDVVKHLIDNNIPVTVFMECSNPKGLCDIDEKEARKIYELNPALVSLGVHALPIGHTQEEQSKRFELICDVIKNIMGKSPVTLSYHGKNAGPENGISFRDIKYARGIKSWTAAQKNNPLDTPVMGLYKVRSAFNYIKLRNEFGFSATLFVHSAELKVNSPQKRVFDTLIKEVRERRLQAMDYYAAMERDFSKLPKCPLAHFKNNKLSQNLYLNHVDGVNGITQVSELQSFLNELGLDAGRVDGFFGKNTKMAVLMYQVDKGLVADGSVGEEMRSSVNTYCK